MITRVLIAVGVSAILIAAGIHAPAFLHAMSASNDVGLFSEQVAQAESVGATIILKQSGSEIVMSQITNGVTTTPVSPLTDATLIYFGSPADWVSLYVAPDGVATVNWGPCTVSSVTIMIVNKPYAMSCSSVSIGAQ